MSIEPVNNSAPASYAAQLPEKQPASPELPAAAQPASASSQDIVNVSLTEASKRQAMGKIHEHIEGRNALARVLQVSAEKLEQASAALVPLKTELFKIIKNYPPFGIDSEDRREILRSYSAIRKEIDSMTVPAPQQQFYQENSSTLSQYFDRAGKLTLQELPVLPLDAPDSHLKDAVAAIDAKIASFKDGPQVIHNLLKNN